MKKIKLLSLLFIFAFFGTFAFSNNIVLADSTTDQTIQLLELQVKQLQSQIKELQQKLLSAGSVPGIAIGEPNPNGNQIPAPTVCPKLSHTLYRGVSDNSTGGEVTKLQMMLAEDQSVYPEGMITGYYGPLTEKAVQNWQIKQGIVSSGSPETTGHGVVGSLTRGKIVSVCQIIHQTISSSNTVQTKPLMPVVPPMMTFFATTTSTFSSSTISSTLPVTNSSNSIVSTAISSSVITLGTTTITNSVATTSAIVSETIVRGIGEQEGYFLIQKINIDSVDGLWYTAYPVALVQGSPRTLHIGDDIGYACEGISDKLASIDFAGQKVTFAKIVGTRPRFGCPR